MFAAPAAFAGDIQLTPDDVVTPPDGLPSKAYSLEANGLSSSFFATEPYFDYGQYSQILFDDEAGTVYFRDIMAGVGGWTKGELSGNQITVALPALQYWYEGFDYGVCLAAVRCTKNDDTWTIVRDESITSATFTIADDGTIKLDSLGDNVGVGLVYTDSGEFMGFTDFNQIRTPFTDTPAQMPDEGVETWGCRIADGYMLPVDVAFAGDEILLRGVFSEMPDAVIKGTLNADRSEAYFYSQQYLGIYENYLSSSNIAYLILGKTEGDDIVWLEPEQPMTFSINLEKGLISTSEEDCLLGNIWKTQPRYFQYLIDFEAMRTPDTLLKPASPCDLEFSQTFEDYGYNRFSFSLPNISQDGYMLDPDRYSYSIFIDGKPYTFEASKYEDLQQAGFDSLEKVPYSLSTSWEIYADKDLRDIVIYENGISTIGVQGYYTFDGATEASELVEISPSGVNEVVTDANVVKREYFDIAGIPVRENAHGLLVCRTTYSDGSVRVEKIRIR